MKTLIPFFFACLAFFGAGAQVNVSLNILPPYSTRLSDYANQPGKMLVTLQHTGTAAIEVYLRAEIKGENGIRIFTAPDYRPPRSIRLLPGSPYVLNVAEIQTLFNADDLSTRGTSLREIERINGLPEGSYEVCVRVYDFNQPARSLSGASPAGCRNLFLRMQEPPQLIKPLKDETLHVTPIQNVLFSWTTPAGAGPGGKYKLRLVELFEGHRNPNDAFQSSPSFFEKVVSGNVYLLGPGDPPLVHGRTYAWAVQSVSDGETSYRNAGRSEVRSFTANLLQYTVANPTPSATDPLTDFNFIHLKGTLRYYWMTAASSSSPTIQSQQPNAVPVSAFSGYQGSALAGATVHLVEALQFENPEFSSNYGSTNPFLPGKILTSYTGNAQGQQLQTAPLATAVTDAEGNFSFHFPALEHYDFSWKMTQILQGGGEFQSSISGRARKVLMVKIATPGSSWYGQPIQHFAKKTSDMGTFYARVKTFNPTVQVADKDDPNLVKDGVEVFIVRKDPRPGLVPKDEGQPGNFSEREKYENYTVVAKGVTDASGRVSFKNIVLYYCNNYQSPYLIFVRPQNQFSTSHSFVASFPNGYPLRYASEQDYQGDCYSTLLKDLKASCYENNCFAGLTAANAGHWSIPYQNPAFPNYNLVPVTKWSARIYGEVINTAAGPLGDLAQKEPGASWFLWRVNSTGAQEAANAVSMWSSPRKWGAYLETGAEAFYRTFALLLEKNSSMVLERTGITDTDGRIDIRSLPSEFNQGVQKGYFYLLIVSKNGFKPVHRAINRQSTASGLAGDMNPAYFGNAYSTGDLLLRPDASLKIRLRSEEGGLIGGSVHYIDPETGQTGNLIPVPSNGNYATLNIPSGNQCKLVILPHNSEKFQSDTLQFPIQGNQEKDLVVKLKLHRIHFKIRGEMGLNLASAKITLVHLPAGAATLYRDIESPYLHQESSSPVPHFPNGNEAPTLGSLPQILGPYDQLTNAAGRADFAFSNSSTGPFTFRISGPSGTAYVCLEKNVMNQAGKTWDVVEIQLSKGRTVSGKVTVGESRVANARVRVKGSVPLIETFTNQNGEYQLMGVPADTNLTFTASKGGSGLVGLEYTEGREYEVKFGKINRSLSPANHLILDFNLRIYEDMDLQELLGFPMEVTSLTQSGASIKVNALLTLPEDGWMKTESLLDLDHVILVPDSRKNEEQVPYARPQLLPVPVSASEMQVRVHDFYAGILREMSLSQEANKLGVLKGKVGILSQSFNDPNFQYQGRMYLKEPDSGNFQLKTFTSNGHRPYEQGLIPSKENGENFVYQLVYSGEFEASALTAGSRLYPDSLRLDTRIKADLQNMSALNLHAGTLVLGRDRKLKPFKNTVQHTLNLQQFKLDLTELRGDNSGLKLQGKVRALGMEMPFQNAALFPDRILLNGLNVGKLSLPGNIPLELNNPASFGYEAQLERWYLAVLPSDNGACAAKIKGQYLNLSNPDATVDFSSIWLYSDGNRELHLTPSQAPLQVYRVAQFHLQGVELSESTLALNGLLNLGIPDLPAYQTGLLYQNSGFSIRPFQMSSTVVKGIRWNFQNQGLSFSTGRLTIKGILENQNPDIFSGIAFTLTKTNASQQYDESAMATVLSLDEPPQKQKIKLGGQGNSRMEVRQLQGQMTVADGSWSTLTFSGQMPDEMGFSPGSNVLNFEVLDGLRVNASTVKLKNMDSPFGELTMHYDLLNHRLLGQLNYEGQLASMKVEADVEFAVDRHGYYFLSAAKMEMSNPKVAGRGFLLMGDYNHKSSDRQEAIENVLKEYSYYYKHMHELPRGYAVLNKLDGFFMEAGAEIPFPAIPNFDIDLVVVSARLEVTVGGDVRLGMNFGEVNSHTMGMSVFVNAEFGLGASVVIACAGIDLKARAGINMDGTYFSNGGYELMVSGFIQVSGTAYAGGGLACDSDCDGLCVKTTASGSIGLAAIGTITHQNSSFELKLDSNTF